MISELTPIYSSHRPQVLVVDDIESNRLSIRRALRKLDVEIVEACTGEQALHKAIASRNLALILLDVQMPELDGYQVAELLQQDEKLKQVPVIFLTAFYKSEANVLRGYQVGAVDYIQKPIVSEVLI